MHFDMKSIDVPATLSAVLAIAVVIGVAAYLIVLGARARRHKRDCDAVAGAVIAYFRHSGVGVAAGCVSLAPRRFTVFIESQPMKRFRLSHIIEATVRDHVKKNTGLDVDKIYWRFPIQQSQQNDAAADTEKAKPEQEKDEYINEGLVNYRHLPKMEAVETEWATFEEISQKMEIPDTSPQEH